MYYENQIVISIHLNFNLFKEEENDADIKVFREPKKLIDRCKYNFIKRKIDYLFKFKWKSAELHYNPNIHQSKIIQEATKNINEDFIEILQPQD